MEEGGECTRNVSSVYIATQASLCMYSSIYTQQYCVFTVCLLCKRWPHKMADHEQYPVPTASIKSLSNIV